MYNSLKAIRQKVIFSFCKSSLLYVKLRQLEDRVVYNVIFYFCIQHQEDHTIFVRNLCWTIIRKCKAPSTPDRDHNHMNQSSSVARALLEAWCSLLSKSSGTSKENLSVVTSPGGTVSLTFFLCSPTGIVVMNVSPAFTP